MSEPGTQAGVSEWESLARSAGGSEHGEEAADLLRELLTFKLAESLYAIPVERVREIVRQ